ncbi:MAG: helix-turn-helix domain-containing protein [Candidatus Diapherotrites archaeon]|nr:helix-turn-helix domain-containing protein [Candidatus Diapherotrites archaeon]
MKSILREIGLTEGEITIYLSLQKLGSSGVGSIVSDTNLQKTTVYFCLNSLISKGLVSYFIRNKIKIFESANPNRLVDFLDEKSKGIEEQKKKVQELIPKLLASRVEKEMHSANVFEGWKGMKTAFDDLYERLKPGETYQTLGVTQLPETHEKFRKFIQGFHLRRAAKKVKLQLILNEDLKDSVGKEREKVKFTEVRYVQREFQAPSFANMYKDKVLMTVWKEKPYAFLIQSQEIADSFRNYFFGMWKTAKTRKQIESEKD